MELNKWITELTSDTAQDIAQKAGLPKRTVQHQLNTGRMSLENIIKISVAYHRHPMRALIEWGIVDEARASVPDIEAALRLASEDQLGDEVLYRMKLGAKTVGNISVDQLAARRLELMGAPDVDTENYFDDTDSFKPERYVAKRKKPEPSEGDDDYGSGA